MVNHGRSRWRIIASFLAQVDDKVIALLAIGHGRWPVWLRWVGDVDVEILVDIQAASGRVWTMLDGCDSVQTTRISKEAALQIKQLV